MLVKRRKFSPDESRTVLDQKFHQLQSFGSVIARRLHDEAERRAIIQHAMRFVSSLEKPLDFVAGFAFFF
jgi:hypothetical protein